MVEVGLGLGLGDGKRNGRVSGIGPPIFLNVCVHLCVQLS